jgi:serine phosphatase RsbU (regulator of sigma subunit)
VVAAHLASLLVLAAVVVVAGRVLYTAGRDLAAEQALETALRPARQAADNIRRHLDGVLDTLAPVDGQAEGRANRRLLRPTARLAAGNDAALWEQVRNRSSDLFVLRVRPTGEVATLRHFGNANAPDQDQPLAAQVEGLTSAAPTAAFPETGEAAEAVAEAAERQKVALLGPLRIGDGGAMSPVMLALAPAGERTVVVAAVPIAFLDRAFLAGQRQSGTLAMTLVGDDARPLSTGNSASEADPQAIPVELQQYVAARVAGRSTPPQLIEARAQIGGETFDGLLPAVAAVRPPNVRNPDAADAERPAARLWVAAALNAESVIGPLRQTTRQAVLWASGIIIVLVGILGSTSATLIRGRNRLEKLRAEVIDKELREARSIQERWLPKDAAVQVEGLSLDVSAANEPASQISGDFYNHFRIPGPPDRPRYALVIGDVTGHGMAAAFLMSTTQLLVRSEVQRLGDPGQALQSVNDQLARQAHGGQFVTLLVAVLDPAEDAVHLASAGHPSPLARRSGDAWHELDVEPELVAGVMEGVEYPTQTHPLAGLEALVFYTDGVTEARDPQGRHLDLAQLRGGLDRDLNGDIGDGKAAVEAVMRVVRTHAGLVGFDDDVTILAASLASKSNDVDPPAAPASRPTPVAALA